jgi:predicted  nucleic acid-binding Zn-ribbon protein
MHVEIESLLTLQGYDQRVSAIEAELDRLPSEETQLDRKFKAQSAGFEELKTKTRQIEADRKKIDLEVQSKQQLIAKYKTQQLQTRKNEEFAALHTEIERAQGEITALEDQELDLMGRYEEGQKEVAQEQANLKTYETQTKQARESLQKKQATLEAELANIKEQQTEAEKKVSEETLHRYRRILASKKDAAVVPILHGNCGGCHMKLTSQTILTAKGCEQLIACENCGRIVYSPE